MAIPVTSRERSRIFGTPGTQRNLVLVTTPWGLRCRIHRLIAERFLAACALAQKRSSWTPRRIDSYANRAVRGSRSTSLHAYGLATDWFDRPLPQAVDVWGDGNAPDAAFRKAFEELGFRLGAKYKNRKDFPHIEWAARVPAGVVPVREGPAKVEVCKPEPEQGPVDKPPVYARWGEAVGVKVSLQSVAWERLDDQGRGFVDIPYPMERVLGFIGQGSNPVDEGYWPAIVATAQPRGATTRVSLSGKPGQGGALYYHLLEEQ